MRGREGRFARWLLASLLVVSVAWLAGFVVGWPKEGLVVQPPSDVPAPANFQLFSQVWQIVDREFYGEKPKPSAITYGAIRGLLSALEDPYATFVPNDEWAGIHGELGPTFVAGLGAWVETTPQGALILAAVPNSSAAAAKLRPHDTILAVGTEALGGQERRAILRLLEGPNNSSVVLAVRRANANPFTVEVIRRRMTVPPFTVQQLEDGVTYLRFGTFDSKLVAEIDQRLPSVLARKPRAAVIDLRDNPGGDPAVLRTVASRLVNGVLYRERRRNHEEIVVSVRPGPGTPSFLLPERLAVLVNHGTVGEAEILAAALRAHRGARLVGDPTFGKGRLQEVRVLADGSALRLTVAEWRTPDGAKVDGLGLAPERRAMVADTDRASGRDRQLEAALHLLSASAGREPTEAGRG